MACNQDVQQVVHSYINQLKIHRERKTHYFSTNVQSVHNLSLYLSAAYICIHWLQYLFNCCYLVLHIYSSLTLTVQNLCLYYLPQCTQITLIIQFLSTFLQSGFIAVILFTVLLESHTLLSLYNVSTLHWFLTVRGHCTDVLVVFFLVFVQALCALAFPPGHK